MTVYLICYGISFILAWQRLYVLSGLVLVGSSYMAVYQRLYPDRKPDPSAGAVLPVFYRRTGSLLL